MGQNEEAAAGRGERIVQILGPLGFNAVYACGGRARRRPVLLMALVECDGEQYLRGYLGPLLTEPVERDPEFIGYIHDSVATSQNWSDFQSLAQKMAERAGQ